MVDEQRGEIRTRDGVTLSTAIWIPSRPKALVLLVHGHAEHLGRYRHVIEALTNRGYVVAGQDHRGHGHSTGERALSMRFDDYVDDFRQMALAVQATHPNLPVVLIGHSMGGLIAARYALAHQADLRALVISGAAFVIDQATPAWQKPIARLVARVYPKAPVPRGNAGDTLSYDPSVKEAFRADPLNWNGRVRIRTAVEMIAAGRDALRRAGELRIPLLAMHGADDRLTSPEGTVLFYEGASSTDKELRLWPHMKHEIFNEVEQASVIDHMLTWLDRRVS
jgi:alpha-beta hydrolase superfamily lysophospholipase